MVEQQGEWVKQPYGALKRTTVFPDGMVRKESAFLGDGVIEIGDNYPNAFKNWYKDTERYFPQEIPEVVRDFLKAKDILQGRSSHRLEIVAFFNETEHVEQYVSFKFPSLLEIAAYHELREQAETSESLAPSFPANIGVSFFERQNPWESAIEKGDFEPGLDALLEVVYDINGSCVELYLQAEKATDSFTGTEEGLGWQELLPTLLSYIREADSKSSFAVNPYDNDPRVEEARQLAEELIGDMISAQPFEDREDTFQTLNKFDWQGKLVAGLLHVKGAETLSLSEALDKYGRDKFLSSEVRGWLDDLRRDEYGSFIHFLEINNLSDTTFHWREVESELGQQGHQDRAVKHEGEGQYKMELPAQDHIFVVDKVGDEIRVSCLSQRRKPLWTAEFPQSIPYEQITDMYEDEKADFRQIKDLLNMSFRKKSLLEASDASL